MKDTRKRQGILVLHKTLDILETVRESRSGLALADLARALGLPKPTAYRIVTTLERRGYIARNPAGHFQMTRKLFDLQQNESDEQVVLRAAQSSMVKLVESSRRGLGGRSQQLVLAAATRLTGGDLSNMALLSGGTDGEDGPTDAAGAVLDADVAAAAQAMNLDPLDYLARNDAYRFFSPLDALIKTGPTQTNVCDVRVVTVGKK